MNNIARLRLLLWFFGIFTQAYVVADGDPEINVRPLDLRVPDQRLRGEFEKDPFEFRVGKLVATVQRWSDQLPEGKRWEGLLKVFKCESIQALTGLDERVQQQRVQEAIASMGLSSVEELIEAYSYYGATDRVNEFKPLNFYRSLEKCSELQNMFNNCMMNDWSDFKKHERQLGSIRALLTQAEEAGFFDSISSNMLKKKPYIGLIRRFALSAYNDAFNDFKEKNALELEDFKALLQKESMEREEELVNQTKALADDWVNRKKLENMFIGPFALQGLAHDFKKALSNVADDVERDFMQCHLDVWFHQRHEALIREKYVDPISVSLTQQVEEMKRLALELEQEKKETLEQKNELINKMKALEDKAKKETKALEENAKRETEALKAELTNKMKALEDKAKKETDALKTELANKMDDLEDKVQAVSDDLNVKLAKSKKMGQDLKNELSCLISFQEPRVHAAFRLTSQSVNIPEVAKGYEDVYEMFLKGALIYKKGEPDEVRLPIADLANPLDGVFDLSRCGDTGNYLSIRTGYRKEKITYPNASPGYGTDRAEIWFAPRFLIERELSTTAGHFQGIMGSWDARTPIGIFWSWSAESGILQMRSPAMDNSKNLYEKWFTSTGTLGFRDFFESCVGITKFGF